MGNQCSICEECSMNELLKFACEQTKEGLDIVAAEGNCPPDEFHEKVLGLSNKKIIQVILASEFFRAIGGLLCDKMLAELGWTKEVVCIKDGMH